MTQEQVIEFSDELMELLDKYNCQDAVIAFSNDSKVGKIRLVNLVEETSISVLDRIIQDVTSAKFKTFCSSISYRFKSKIPETIENKKE